MAVKKLLKKHRYPPEGMDDAVQTVMTQCELWTDNAEFEDYGRTTLQVAKKNYSEYELYPAEGLMNVAEKQTNSYQNKQ